MAVIASISIATIILMLAWKFYFVAGGVPLLFLKHGIQKDPDFVMRFFQVHYVVLILIATLGGLCFLLSGRAPMALAMAYVATVGLLARWILVPRIDRQRASAALGDFMAIRAIKKLQISGIALNIINMIVFGAVLGLVPLETCVLVPPGCETVQTPDGSTVPCRRQCSLLPPD